MIARATHAAIAASLSPVPCTGLAASWCPVCGTCTCPRYDDGGRVRDDAGTVWGASCPLHGATSTHAEGEVEP